MIDERARGLRGPLLREPLVHFGLIGAALFLLDALTGTSAPRPDHDAIDRTLVIDTGTRRAIADDFLHGEGRAPTDAELDARIAAWRDEEILYREGLARELDAHDGRVRARVATLMADVLRAERFASEPTEAELRAYFDASPERWAEPERIDFVHVFFEGTDDAEARAAELLPSLRAGASPARMGDTFSGGRHYRGRRLSDLRESFGEAFVDDLSSAEADAWFVTRSRFGVHLVRVERRSAGSDADFDRVRLDVAHALNEARETEAMERALAELRARWTIVDEGGDEGDGPTSGGGPRDVERRGDVAAGEEARGDEAASARGDEAARGVEERGE